MFVEKFHPDPETNHAISIHLDLLVEYLASEKLASLDDKYRLLEILVACFYSEKEALKEALQKDWAIQITAVPMDLSDEVKELKEQLEALQRDYKALEESSDRLILRHGLTDGNSQSDGFWADLSASVEAP